MFFSMKINTHNTHINIQTCVRAHVDTQLVRNTSGYSTFSPEFCTACPDSCRCDSNFADGTKNSF